MNIIEKDNQIILEGISEDINITTIINITGIIINKGLVTRYNL